MIRFAPLILLGSSLILSVMASAANAATLIVPEAFDVLSVNGLEQSVFSLAKEKHLKLKQGRNIVVLEYDEIFDSQLNDSHESVRPAPYALIFDVSKESILRLQTPNTPNLDAAERYAKAPEFSVEDEQKQAITIVAKPAKDLTYASVLDANSEASTSASQAPSISPVEGAMLASANKQNAAHTNAELAKPDALNMLLYWWTMANEQERKAFLKSLESSNQSK